MPSTRADLLTTPGLIEFLDPPIPDGASPYVGEAGPGFDVRIVDPDPEWPGQAAVEITRIRHALTTTVVGIEHVGSTSVAGLPAKPVIDLDLLVPDPDEESSYVDQLERAGYELVVREPWWYGHRMFRRTRPAVNLHVYGPESAESARQRLFRDWLREHPADRDRYAAAKREASTRAAAAGEHVQDYNLRKQAVLREIYRHLFHDAGLD